MQFLKMWISMLSIGTLFVGSLAFAEGEVGLFSGCGEYEVTGIIRKSGNKMVLKVKEGTSEQIEMDFDKDLGEVATIYQDKSVAVKAKVLAPVKNGRGTLLTLKSSKEVAAMRAKGQPYSARFDRDDISEKDLNPLHPEMDSGFVLTKKRSCR